jgi:protein-S-isoprenylcysteine O-methyltransferase Ste14
MQIKLVATVIAATLTLPLMYYLEIFVAKDNPHIPADIDFLLYINIVCLIVLFVFEIKTMSTSQTKSKSSDRGFLSALITIAAVIYMPVLDRYSWQVFSTGSNYKFYYAAGLTLFGLGVIIRKSAATRLGEYFTHELRVTPGQKVIDKGLYRFIRHPAYLGTLLLVLGISWMFLSNIGLLLMFPMMILALYRIKNEEKMLKAHLGLEYQEYILKTKKLIPFIL